MQEYTVQVHIDRPPTVYDIGWASGYIAYWVNSDDEEETCKKTLHEKVKTTRDQERKIWLHRLAGYMTAEREVETGRYVRFSVHPVMGLGRWFDEGERLIPHHLLGASHAFPTSDP